MKRLFATIVLTVGLLGFAGPAVAEPVEPLDADTSRDQLCVTLHLGRFGSPHACAPML